MANFWKSVGTILFLTIFTLISGCANFTGGSLGELIIDASRNTSRKDLENYKFDLLPAGENSLEHAVSTTDLPTSDENAFEVDPASVIGEQETKKPIQIHSHSHSTDHALDNSFVPRQNQLRPIAMSNTHAILKPVHETIESNDAELSNLPEIPSAKNNDFSGALKRNLPEKKLSLPPPFGFHPPCKKCDYKSDLEKIAAPTTAVSGHRVAPNEPLPDFVEELISQSIDPDAMLLVAKSVCSTTTAAKPKSWSDQLQNTIEIFESEILNSESTAQKSRLENSLQILRSMQRNLGRPVDLGQPENAYWLHQVRVLNAIMDDGADDWSVTASNALSHLKEAAKPLREAAKLKLNSVAFCRKVSGFGQYETFESTEFSSNQKVLVYCEIENFVPKEVTGDDNSVFETRISSSFWIKDSLGKTVQNVNFPAVTDIARKVRSDFFMHIPIQFLSLPAGDYRLQLEVRDLGSGKSANPGKPLSFTIR